MTQWNIWEPFKTIIYYSIENPIGQEIVHCTHTKKNP